MRTAHCLKRLKPLMKKPFFSSKEAKAVGVHPSAIAYFIKSGRVKRIARGLYQSSEYANASSFRWEDLIEAVYTVKDGVICLTSALAIYDLTEEIPRQHWIAIPHSTSTKKAQDYKIIRFRNPLLGKTSINLEGAKVPIYDRERTIIDAFRFLSIETAIKALKFALKGKKQIDLNKLQDYAQKLHIDIKPYLMSITV
ncbi:MAG: type IV toxin-antitoxin system AbiEi family antitoxin domain-containing protein [Verrucomicrobia bacterium]|nr:type IV toxin-antitoxin system AbiEi family antitoxin domain-containing protein [Verrucomicrobiota bacterium]